MMGGTCRGGRVNNDDEEYDSQGHGIAATSPGGASIVAIGPAACTHPVASNPHAIK